MSAAGGHQLQAYDHPGTDAALLLAPVVAFHLDRETLEGTAAAIERELRHGDFVYRYKCGDGLEGGEGAVLTCCFWLADALLHLGCHAEATALFERLVKRANDVGLYAEEIDPETGRFSAISHRPSPTWHSSAPPSISIFMSGTERRLSQEAMQTAPASASAPRLDGAPFEARSRRPGVWGGSFRQGGRYSRRPHSSSGSERMLEQGIRGARMMLDSGNRAFAVFDLGHIGGNLARYVLEIGCAPPI